MVEAQRTELPRLVRLLLDTIGEYPPDVRVPLGRELNALLDVTGTLSPVMVRSYTRAVLITLEYAEDGVLQLHQGDMAKMAKGGAAIDAIMAAHLGLTAEQAFERYLETGNLVDVAKPSPGAIRGPAGHA